jgi:glycosyltransferase involved in cell wall biosynthesis
MFDKKWINVVITTFQHEAWIQQSIDSVLNQDYPYIKNIFIIDDCSEDKTFEILKSYQDSRIKLFRNDENMGVSYSANRILDIACADRDVDYIAIFSGDDVWAPEKISSQIEFLRENTRYDIIFTDCLTIDEVGNISPRMPIFDYENTSRHQWVFKLFLKNWFVGSSVLFRRSLWKNIGPFDIRLRQIQDWKLWISAVSKGFEVYVLEKPLVYYRFHTNSISNNESPEKNARLLTEIPFCLEAFRDISIGDLRSAFPSDLDRSDLFGNTRSVDVGLAVLSSMVNSRAYHQFAAETMSGYYKDNYHLGLMKDKEYHQFIGNLRK